MFTNPIQIEKPNASSHDGLKRIMEISQRRAALRARESRQTTSADLSRLNNAAGLSRQITRRFKAGDVYAPHDLSEVEMKKWKQRSRPEKDVFDVLDFNPMDHYRVCFFQLVACSNECLLEFVLELLNHVRIHDSYGEDHAQ